MEIYSTDEGMFSVDMMKSYLNIFGNEVKQVSVDTLIHNMDFECWSVVVDEESYVFSPWQVLRDSEETRVFCYQEMKRIENADLSYPIIVWRGFVVDGMHRLSKSVMKKYNTILITEFDDEMLEKFKISGNEKIHNLMELFYERFVKAFA